ncbi:RNA polymerase sigma factor [Actinomadura algeriensis]|uniref:RNA polymerase sigma factor (Sigma-70 family) n=1 Tax=Actinomadura algeriensis TaxID=1679523 RepID=A0ABR9K4W3_9ACTN|nr:sigma-70 family RNA polymerase sigma factor [Actinomadura algeriensis]MBE1537872.1 RNA polymerase sigma factor (sigma-70 family) [Actinomadura algeriensis]
MARHDESTGVRTDDACELAARARDGDGAAWDRLVKEHSPLLWAVARSHGLHDADARDVVQTTWLRLVEKIDTVREDGAVRVWLVTTARRESLRVVDLHGRAFPTARPAEPSAGASVGPSAEPAPDRVVLGRERVGRVGAALQRLPQRCRTLLRLYALAPTYKELAAALDIPLGSVGPTRARCLDALRGLLR